MGTTFFIFFNGDLKYISPGLCSFKIFFHTHKSLLSCGILVGTLCARVQPGVNHYGKNAGHPSEYILILSFVRVVFTGKRARFSLVRVPKSKPAIIGLLLITASLLGEIAPSKRPSQKAWRYTWACERGDKVDRRVHWLATTTLLSYRWVSQQTRFWNQSHLGCFGRSEASGCSTAKINLFATQSMQIKTSLR